MTPEYLCCCGARTCTSFPQKYFVHLKLLFNYLLSPTFGSTCGFMSQLLCLLIGCLFLVYEARVCEVVNNLGFD